MIAPIDGVDNYTVHLVYSPSVQQVRTQRAAADPEKQQKPTNQELRQRRGNVNVNGQTANSTNQTQQFQTPASQAHFQVPAGATNGDWGQLHQQMYNAYMSNYLSYLQQVYGASSPNNVSSPFNNFAFPTTNVNLQEQTFRQHQQAEIPGGPNQNVPPEPAAARPDPAEAPPAPPPAPNNQGPQFLNVGVGGNQPQAVNRERDWLEHVYTALRASIFLMLLFYYSSIERFVFLMLCIAAIYGYHQGWFGLRGDFEQAAQPQAEVQPPAEAPAAAPAEQVGENPNVVAEEEGIPTLDENNPPPAAETEEEPSAWEVFWSTCYIFITSFFASMIPERAPPEAH